MNDHGGGGRGLNFTRGILCGASLLCIALRSNGWNILILTVVNVVNLRSVGDLHKIFPINNTLPQRATNER